MECLGAEDGVDGVRVERDCLRAAREGLGLRNNLFEHLAHHVVRLDRDDLREAGHEVTGQLAGAGAEIEHGRINRQLEFAHHEVDQLLRPPWPAELVLASRVPERVGRSAALSQRPQATRRRLGGAA